MSEERRVYVEAESLPKREAILTAALHLFSQFGYHGTTVPQVADKAKVGAGTVYRYFENKEALVNALYQKWKQALGSALMRDFPVGRPVREQFHEIWRRMAKFSTENPRAIDFLEFHYHRDYLDKKSVQVEDEMLQPMNLFILDAQERRELKKMKPAILGALVWGSFLGLVQAQRKGLLHLDDETLDAAEETMWHAIRR